MSEKNDKNKAGSKINETDNLYNVTTEVTSDNVKAILGSNSDFKSRVFLIRDKAEIPATLAYIDGLVDGKIISLEILKPLAQDSQFDTCSNEADALKLISMGKIYTSDIKVRTNLKDLIDDLLSGSTAIIFDSEKTAFTFESKVPVNRSINEPTGESVIKGSKDAFIEDLRTNTALVRKKIRSPYLTIEEISIGKQTRTQFAIVYMSNIVNSKLVEEVRKRLKAMDIDRVLTPGVVEEYLIDTKYSTFPELLYTERPDRFCVGITDGRVGIMINGIPLTYIVPGTLLQYIQAPDDYSYHFIIGSVLRALRFMSMFITLVLPGFYICITTFHPEMLPAELAFSIVASKEGVPFPMFVEVLILLIAFEILLEAGLRLPKAIGQTVSIVGALVVGQAAVEAKLVSPATVIMTAITVIAGFTMPTQDFSNALRIWRFILVVYSSIIGIFGLTFGMIFLLFHWCKMESYGVPYLDPFVANEDEQLQDTIVRSNITSLKKRPSGLDTINKTRRK